jgi:Helix-turn-helix domain
VNRNARERSTAPRRRRVRLDAVESPPSDAEVLSSSDLAQLLGVHPKTVAGWTAEAGLPSFRTIGGHRRYRWGDVSVWLIDAALQVPELLHGDDIGGIAVHIAQRVQTRAEPDEVLVSRTVTDLVGGSGIEFQDRGDHELKGVPGSWRLFGVRG